MSEGQKPEGQDMAQRLAALDPVAAQQFLRAYEFYGPRVWAFLNAEVGQGQERGLDPALGLLALASALLDAMQGLMEIRSALAAAGGDADVAALMLGLRSTLRVVPDAPAAPPPPIRSAKRRRR
ncbi:MAG: hypothetical protein HY403_01810 [Elusimicrobia bacterium]|nr:hypothetical protein [Elusimicrobiota bacterium]